MFTILHGDDEGKIAQARATVIETAKKNGREVVRLDGKKLTQAELETAIGTDLLFAPEKTVIIEGFLSSVKSRKKDELVTWLQKNTPSSIDVIFAETKVLTATQLKAITSPHSTPSSERRGGEEVKIQLFKYPQILFSFLEQIGVVPLALTYEQFHHILEREEAPLIFAMIVRQVRQLLQLKSDGTFVGAPFMRGKLEKQAKVFTLEKLLKLHEQLLLIDEQVKTSGSPLTLTQQLDLWLAQV
ncbi:hypothetical protein C5B42_02115 [Candidatus Cerribacteria bacterium 'Amazon FNV 2010 28 9']|uniref:DNA-directed DNA polymerase n=1 Tax=Candidatus Cerribacteria bacterium 'Amazon FNV 2010 28 9' TaxID=2081795 RepID=A0A317JQI7_9BACT|nr:MAG: hypothetical protein C5B42_02115 [Candidatus Cerribacteria bacterium 'Amazon FNV 2010 28 9']